VQNFLGCIGSCFSCIFGVLWSHEKALASNSIKTTSSYDQRPRCSRKELKIYCTTACHTQKQSSGGRNEEQNSPGLMDACWKEFYANRRWQGCSEFQSIWSLTDKTRKDLYNVVLSPWCLIHQTKQGCVRLGIQVVKEEIVLVNRVADR
jgi:hypothetical protein